jgi:hypothetical protein
MQIESYWRLVTYNKVMDYLMTYKAGVQCYVPHYYLENDCFWDQVYFRTPIGCLFTSSPDEAVNTKTLSSYQSYVGKTADQYLSSVKYDDVLDNYMAYSDEIADREIERTLVEHWKVQDEE